MFKFPLCFFATSGLFFITFTESVSNRSRTKVIIILKNGKVTAFQLNFYHVEE